MARAPHQVTLSVDTGLPSTQQCCSQKGMGGFTLVFGNPPFIFHGEEEFSIKTKKAKSDELA